MPRAIHAPASKRRKKKVLKFVKGQRGSRSRLSKIAIEGVRAALISNYIDRKKRKRDFRSLWITRITAACKAEGISYSRFIDGLNKAGIKLNRKMLADIAENDNKAFKALVKKAANK